MINKSFLARKKNLKSASYNYWLKNKVFFKQALADNLPSFDIHHNVDEYLKENYKYLVTPNYITDSIKKNKFTNPENDFYAVTITSKQQEPNTKYQKNGHVLHESPVSLHKQKVINMLQNVLNKVMDTKEVDNKSFKINGYKRAIQVWGTLDESQFHVPITLDQILQVNGIGSSIGSKIMDTLNSCGNSKSSNAEEEDVPNETPWIESYFNRMGNNTKNQEKMSMKSYFAELYGIGDYRASQYVNDPIFGSQTKSITDLCKNFPQDITIPLLYGWRYFDDFQTKVPREEVKYHNDIVYGVCKKYDIICEATGSYRRGQKPFLGDIDYTLFKRGENDSRVLRKLLRKVVDDLIALGYIDCVLQGFKNYKENYFLGEDLRKTCSVVEQHIKSSKVSQRLWPYISDDVCFENIQNLQAAPHDSKNVYVGASIKNMSHSPEFDVLLEKNKLIRSHSLKPEDDIFQDINPLQLGQNGVGICRRVDFLMVKHSEVYAAKIYFTGSNFFNRSCRIIAKKKYNLKLTNKGLYDLSNGGKEVKMKNCESEYELLEKLGLTQYADPTSRELNNYIEM